MKHTLIFFTILLLASTSSRSQLINRIKNSAKYKAENKVLQKTDNAMDKAIDGKWLNKKDTVPAEQKKQTVASKEQEKPQTSTPSMSLYANSDFMPGEKVIVFEDFLQDPIGEFPDKWNTTSGGEVVKINGKEGHWLKLDKPGVFMPTFIKELPENFTLEFDLISSQSFRYESSPFHFAIAQLKTPQEYTVWQQGNGGRNGFNTWLLPMSPSGQKGKVGYESKQPGGNELIQQFDNSQFISPAKNEVKVSVWRQKQRIRIYLNEEKVVDVAKALPGSAYNALVFALNTAKTEPDYYLLSNIRLAFAEPVQHNKLLTEGKLVTTGIFFDVNSDRIKPESYQVLKSVGTVLQENSSLRIKITGHTDSDGETGFNLNLSKKRSAAVKAFLAKEFKIAENRIETDGKGETEPIDKNNTPAAKANNRRVEFTRIP